MGKSVKQLEGDIKHQVVQPSFVVAPSKLPKHRGLEVIMTDRQSDQE